MSIVISTAGSGQSRMTLDTVEVTMTASVPGGLPASELDVARVGHRLFGGGRSRCGRAGNHRPGARRSGGMRGCRPGQSRGLDQRETQPRLPYPGRRVVERRGVDHDRRDCIAGRKTLDATTRRHHRRGRPGVNRPDNGPTAQGQRLPGARSRSRSATRRTRARRWV